MCNLGRRRGLKQPEIFRERRRKRLAEEEEGQEDQLKTQLFSFQQYPYLSFSAKKGRLENHYLQNKKEERNVTTFPWIDVIMTPPKHQYKQERKQRKGPPLRDSLSLY